MEPKGFRGHHQAAIPEKGQRTEQEAYLKK